MLHFQRHLSQTASFTKLGRRHILKGLILLPLAACAFELTEQAALAGPSIGSDEDYHLFIPPILAQRGGKYSFRTIAGEEKIAQIPKNCKDGTCITLNRQGLSRANIILTLHTLSDDQGEAISRRIGPLLQQQELQASSQTRCQNAYQTLCDGKFVDDLSSLDLLDFIVASSELDEALKAQYRIASLNTRAVGLSDYLEQALTAAHLKRTEKQAIWSAAICVKSGRPVFDLAALAQLDTLIQNSELPISLKQHYSWASSTSRALTADIVLLDLIQRTYGEHAAPLIATYCQIRDGQDPSEPEQLTTLDNLITGADISPEIQLAYLLTRRKTVEQLSAEVGDSQTLEDFIETAKQLENTAQNLVPVSHLALATIGATTAKGVTLSSLSGAVGTNATLSALGGSLGMLGGVGFVTGGAALLGAAGLLMFLNTSQLNHQERVRLGVAAATGITGSAAAVATAWSLTGLYGMASTGTAISSLSGAAAYSAIMSALGGTGALTGGATLLAFGMGYGTWLLLQSRASHHSSDLSPKEQAQTAKQLELLLYTLQEDITSPRVANHYPVVERLTASSAYKEANLLTFAPKISIQQLQTIFQHYEIQSDEVILACYESDGWGLGDQYTGLVFSDRRLLWKQPGDKPQAVAYGQANYLLRIQTLLGIEAIRESEATYGLLMSFAAEPIASTDQW